VSEEVWEGLGGVYEEGEVEDFAGGVLSGCQEGREMVEKERENLVEAEW
jgi:hypothetical protein